MGERGEGVKPRGVGSGCMNAALSTPPGVASPARGRTDRGPGPGLPARIPQGHPAPPAPEKVLCKRNLYANVVLLLLRHPCLRGWGHLKMLSKELCGTLSRAGLPSPWPGPLPLRGLPSHWSWCSLEWHRSRRRHRTHRPPPGPARGVGRTLPAPQKAVENELLDLLFF